MKKMMKMVEIMILVVSSLLFSMCNALPFETHVTVADAMTGLPITVHCFSGSNDLGYHTLSYLEYFAWHFQYSRIGNTKFLCDITTQYGSGRYTVYDNDLEVNQCGTYCLWQVQASGPCLQLTRGGLACQPWQRHPTLAPTSST